MDKKGRRGLRLQILLPGIGLVIKLKFRNGPLFFIKMTAAQKNNDLSINLFALRMELRLTKPTILINQYAFI